MLLQIASRDIGQLTDFPVGQTRPVLPSAGASRVARRLVLSPFGLLGFLAPGQPDLLDVQPGLDLAQHGVVDAALVAQPEHDGALAGQHGLAQRRVLPVVVQGRLVRGVAVVGVQQAQVLGVLALEPRSCRGPGEPSERRRGAAGPGPRA
jgi:hypothetical protein